MTYMPYESVRVDRLIEGDLLAHAPLDGSVAVVIGDVKWVSQDTDPQAPRTGCRSYKVCWAEWNWDGQGNKRIRYFTKIGAAIVLIAPREVRP